MHSMGWAIFSSRRIVPPMIWNMEPGTSGVTGPWVMSRETMRCQEEKLPAVVRAWLSSLCRASLTSFGPMVAALPFLNKDRIQLKLNTVDFSWMKRQMFHQVSCNILNT